MKPEKVISAVESTIIRVTRDIKKKQGNTGSDKLNSLSKLVNSYNKLIEKTKDGSQEEEFNHYDELEKELKILRERDQSQILLDISGVMFVTLDTKGIVTLVNKKACEIFGYEEREMLGKNWFENFLPKRIRKEVLPVSKKILSGKIFITE